MSEQVQIRLQVYTLTTRTFHLLLTGALGVNMMVRSRCDTGVFSHSREFINCWA